MHVRFLRIELQMFLTDIFTPCTQFYIQRQFLYLQDFFSNKRRQHKKIYKARYQTQAETVALSLCVCVFACACACVRVHCVKLIVCLSLSRIYNSSPDGWKNNSCHGEIEIGLIFFAKHICKVPIR